MKNIPPKIYLQIGEDVEPDDFKKLSDITWCDDNINETDIEYIEAGRVKKLVKELETALDRRQFGQVTAYHTEKLIAALKNFKNDTT